MKLRSIIIALLVCTTSVMLAQNYKIKDSSSKKVPDWKSGLMKGHFIGGAEASTLDEAKEKAFLDVKRQITNAVAVQISSSSESHLSEINSDNISEYYEKFSSATSSKSAKRDFLTGVSENKVKDYYWEKREAKESKTVTYSYSILYPFSQLELKQLVDEFLKKEQELTDLMNKTLIVLEDYRSIEEISQAKSQLLKLSNLFSDDRKSRCEIGIEKANALLKSVLIVDKGSTLGLVQYSLMIGDRVVTYASRPRVNANCAYISNQDVGRTICKITYDYADCYAEHGNNVNVSYRIQGGNDVKKEFRFDMNAKMIKIGINGAIRFTCASVNENGYFAKAKIVVPMVSKTDAPYLVSKVVLELPNGQILEKEVNQSYQGAGQHDLTIDASEDIEESLSATGMAVEINGNIYYKEGNSVTEKMKRLYKQAALISAN